MSRIAPSPPSRPIFGHALAFRRDPLGFLRATAATCGPVARLQLGPLTYHLVSDPALVAEILQTRAANYTRDGRSARQMRLVTGESLLSTSGDTWRRHRRLAQPIFHQRRLAAFATTTLAATQELTARWEAAARAGTPIDLASDLSRLTFTIVGRALFSTDLGPHADAVEAAYPVLVDELFRRSRALANLPLWVPTPAHRRFHQALATIDDLVGALISARRREPAPRDDLLDALLQARDEDGSALTDAEIRNHAVTFLLAGHETTASTLIWTFSLLDRHPESRHALESELADVRRGTAPTLESLPRLIHLNAALLETMRLYPAIWLAERRVQETDTLGGFAIPAGSAVVVSAYVTQRRPDLWPEPDAFHPARFTAPAAHPGLAQGYFPFGAGPHQCIGQHVAMLEARLVLAAVFARFRVHLLGDVPTPIAGITLRAAARLPARVEIR
jgi:cytochrome P450